MLKASTSPTSDVFSQIPERFNFARDVVDAWGRDRGRIALYFEDEAGHTARYAFWDFSIWSNRFANLLSGLGLRRGEPVLVILPRLPQWHAVVLAGLKLGAIVIPCTASLRPKDVAYRAQHSGARAVITTAEGVGVVDAVREQCPGLAIFVSVGGGGELPTGWIDGDAAAASASENFEVADTRSDEAALCYYTSGTTKDPKAVLHSHAYTWCHRLTGREWLDVRADGLHWTTADTGWAKAAYGVLFGPWSQGAPILMVNARFDPARQLKLIERYAVTTFCAPPTEYRMLVKQDMNSFDLSSLRHCTGAGEPLNPEVMRIWHERTGRWIHDGYGQTESIILLANLPGMEIRPGSMGLPLPGHDVVVLDDDGQEAAPGEVGEVAVRGRPPSLLLEYWKSPGETAEVFRDGIYFTGDRAQRDEDGYFWFVGRADDVILSAGYRIGPFEVESALLEHPAVLESGVVGAPDAERGELVTAFIVLCPGLEASDALADELRAHVKTITAPYKYPRRIEFVTELPKTISGKIRRTELRARLRGEG